MGQREVAKEIWDFLLSRGWTKESVAGILGNIQSESSFNPDIWSNDGGYGLVQWTPGSKLINWCNEKGMNYKTVNAQCQRIQYEMENGIQWFSNPQRPDLSYISFKDFTKLTDIKKAAEYFIAYYEHPANPNQPARATQAQYWYDQFKNQANTTSQGGIEMQALITVGQGNKKGVSWFDGQKRHNLPHTDCATILNEIYHKNTGKYMPNIDLSGDKEAWLVRLDQAINAGS
ncbi:phage tail tip lysozyme [Enterococcus devriesei]|uniref:phage tail tip lysozyme n=1 Tax=Enterococcus devriesei TaxID=319970 RepID=UPI0028B1AFC9|nr:phage tail tip lysozyme [Enterococcus devriesei]